MTSLRFFLLCTLAFALPVQAEMYKHVDEKGRVTYSNKPIKGGQKIELPELSTMPSPKKPAPAPATSPAPAKPTPDPAVEKAKLRKELEEQITQAEKALAEAKRAYQEGSEKPEVWQRKTADGKTVRGRNVAAYDEKMKALQDNVDARQKALDQLKSDLAALDAPAIKPDEKR